MDSDCATKVPVLLVPNKNTWSMYNILDNKFLKPKLILPGCDISFAGSSRGWLASVNEKLAVTLYKPMMNEEKANGITNLPPLVKSNTTIQLPPLLPPIEEDELKFRIKHRDDYVFKVTIFEHDPIANSNDLIVVVIFGEFCELAYFRTAKDTVWNRVTGMERVVMDDVVYYNDKFYALTYNGKLATFDVTKNNSELKLIVDEISDGRVENKVFCYKKYLVKSYEGDLLQVKRYINQGGDFDDRETKKFKVYKLSFGKWVEVKSLGDMALFLGDNSSISVFAPDFVGCKSNAIYFTHDKDSLPLGVRGPWDLGVYHLQSGSVTPHFELDHVPNIAKLRRRPIWAILHFI